MSDLASRAVAYPGWRWMPGMRWLAVRDAPLEAVVSRVPDRLERGWAPYRGARPDLNDPATLGCLLVLAEEAWAKHGAVLVVEPDDRISPGDGWEAWAYWPDTRSECVGVSSDRSRVSALVAALEAAGRREVSP